MTTTLPLRKKKEAKDRGRSETLTKSKTKTETKTTIKCHFFPLKLNSINIRKSKVKSPTKNGYLALGFGLTF